MAPYPRGRAQLLTAISLLAAVWISSPLGPTRAAIPPTFSTISSLDPDGGQILRGGTQYLVQWNATHENDTRIPTTIAFSSDGGANYTVLDAGNYSTGGASHDWSVPTIDTTLGRVRVCVDEGGGNWSCRESAGDFTVDSTPPVILLTEPADGAVNVSLTQPLRIVFSEEMDAPSVSLTLAPMIPLTYMWSSASDLLVSPTVGWPSCTSVTIAVWGQDLAGNPLVPGPVPNPWTFTTTCGFPFVVATTPPAGATEATRWADIEVRFSEPMNASTVTWELAPPIRVVPTWSDESDVLTLSFKETNARLNVTANPDYYDGNPDWFCRQRWPNSESISVTANTLALQVSIRATGGGDNDLAIFRDVNANGVCDFGVDTLLFVSATSTAMEEITLTTFEPGFYLAQVGLWGPGSEVFDIIISHTRAMDPCALYTAAILSGKDLDGNDLVPGLVPNPWGFTTDCASPYVASTTPADGEADILRNDPVVISFSEGMNPNSIGIAFTPAVTGRSYSWDSQYTVLTVAHDLLLPCTDYRVTVGARDPSDNTLLPGPAPNPWSFVTSCAPSASVRVLSPAEGDSWTGGTNRSVAFEIENTEPFARIFVVSAVFRYAGGTREAALGTTNVTVAGESAARGESPWSVPLLDATDVLVNIQFSDANLSLVTESGPFEIDSTPPTVLAATPMGARIPFPVDLSIGFSEPMALPASDPLDIVPPVGQYVTWASADSLRVALSGVLACTEYDVAIGAPLTDESDPGNPLLPFAWSFATTCAPTIDLVTPVGGEDGTGGSVHEISWTSADSDDDVLIVTVSYSPDAGATWVVVEGGLVVEVGPASYSWTLPRIDVSDITVRVEAVDSLGNGASDTSVPLAIDSTPPSLERSSPATGALDVGLDREVSLEWSELVDRASFEAALSIMPPVGSLALTWSIGEGGRDVLAIGHDPFQPDTEYAVSLASTAKDGSDPGNYLAEPVVVRFRTLALPPVVSPVARAVGPIRAQVGERVTFDGTQSTGDLIGYEWRVADDRGGPVAVLFGTSPTHVFRDGGQYRILLVVTDVRGETDMDAFDLVVTSSPAVWIVLGGALLFAAGLSTTEGGKFFVLKLLLVPLYARRRRNELLEHQTRGMILGYLMMHPGDTYSHLKRNLQLPNGTLSYHLVVLEREGILRAQTYGVYKRFFPVGVRVPEDGGGLHEVQMRMLGAIREVPGLAVKDIAGALGITSQHALYHIRGLAARGLVRLERKGVRLRCFPDERPATAKGTLK